MINANTYTVETKALQVLTSEESRYYQLLPYHLDGDSLCCFGIEGREYADTIKEISLLFGKTVAVHANSALNVPSGAFSNVPSVTDSNVPLQMWLL